MNGLEALEEIKCDMEYVTRLDFVEPIVRGEVRDRLKKIYLRELDQLDQIEKELKAFETIKSHMVSRVNDASGIYFEKNGDLYELKLRNGCGCLFSEDEFILIEEGLK